MVVARGQTGSLIERNSPVEDYGHVYHGSLLAHKDTNEWSGLSVQLRRLAPMQRAFPPLADVEICMHVYGQANVVRVGDGITEEHEMAVGDITISPPFTEDWRAWNERPTILSVSIHSELIADYLEHELDIDPASVKLMRRFAIEDKPLRAFCFALLKEMRDPRPCSALYVADLTWHAIGHLLRRHATLAGKNEPLGMHKGTRSLERVVEYVQANLDKEHTLNTLAAVAQMSVHRLSKAFKAEMNMTPYEFVMFERLTCALVRLRSTRCSSATIAAEAGFGNVRHLANAVAEMTGASLAGD